MRNATRWTAARGPPGLAAITTTRLTDPSEGPAQRVQHPGCRQELELELEPGQVPGPGQAATRSPGPTARCRTTIHRCGNATLIRSTPT